MADPREVLERTRTVAVVGMSSNPVKAAFGIPAGLQAAGFRIVPVNPSADEILGEQVYRTLADIPFPVDAVDVFRPGEEAPDIARQAAAIGAKVLWLQKGIVSEDARRIATDAGLDYFEDLCMGVERSRYGITKWSED